MIILCITLLIALFALIYKYFDKIKAACASVKEKIKAFIYTAKIKVINVYVNIKNFFGRIFKSVGR